MAPGRNEVQHKLLKQAPNYIELLAYPAAMTKYILIELVTIRPNQIID